MNKKTTVSIALFVAALGLVTFMSMKGMEVYREKKEGVAFDNSKPGLWKVNSKKTFPSDAKLNQEDSFEVCVTEKMINDSKSKALEEKFDVKGLKCETVTSRSNHFEGKFLLNCSGTNPANNRKVVAKIDGKVDSHPENGALEVNYELSNNVDASFKFQLQTKSTRVGECKPKEEKAAK